MMRKYTQKFLISTIFVASLVFVGATTDTALAATTDAQIKSGVTAIGGDDDGNKASDLTATIKNVVNLLLFLIGVTAVIFIIIAAFRFVTANGDSNSVTSARNTILYAVVGLVVAISAYAIVNFVVGQL